MNKKYVAFKMIALCSSALVTELNYQHLWRAQIDKLNLISDISK